MDNGNSPSAITSGPPVPRDRPAAPRAGRGSLGNAFRRAFRAMRGEDPVPRDDRGTPITLESRIDLINTVVRERNQWSQLRWVWILLFPAYIIGLWVWRGATPQMLATAAPALIVVLVVLLTRGGRTSVRTNIASLLRAARCGACGFPLTDLPVHRDGCVVCPECASAWQSARWSSRSQATDTLAERALAQNLQRGDIERRTDDRGALVSHPMVWKPKWRNDVGWSLIRVPNADHDRAFKAFNAEARRAASRARRPFLLIVGAFLLLSVIVIVANGDDALFALPTGAIMLVLSGVIIPRRVRTRVDVRAIALNNSLCPSCGELLDVAQPRQFDGCIQCAKCAGAWKVSGPAAQHAGDGDTSTSGHTASTAANA